MDISFELSTRKVLLIWTLNQNVLEFSFLTLTVENTVFYIFCQLHSWKKGMWLIGVLMMKSEVSRYGLIVLAIFISFSVNFRVCQSIQEFKLQVVIQIVPCFFHTRLWASWRRELCLVPCSLCCLANTRHLCFVEWIPSCMQEADISPPLHSCLRESHFQRGNSAQTMSPALPQAPFYLPSHAVPLLYQNKALHLQRLGQHSNLCINSTSTETDK